MVLADLCMDENTKLSPLLDRYGLSNMDTPLEGTPDDMTVVDAASLRRQVCKTQEPVILRKSSSGKMGEQVFCLAAKVPVPDVVRGPLSTSAVLPPRVLGICRVPLQICSYFLGTVRSDH